MAIKGIRRGVSETFPSLESYVHSWSATVPRKLSDESRLARYAQSGTFVLDQGAQASTFRFGPATCADEFRRSGNDFALISIKKLVAQDPLWERDWLRALAYFRCGISVEFLFHAYALDKFERGERRQRLAMIPFDDAVWITANCFIYGWEQWANDLYRCSMDALDRGLFLESGSHTIRQAHSFCLRLLNEYLNPEQKRVWPKGALDEPIYNELLDRWQEENDTILSELLLAACDRHTYEARPDSDTKTYDFRRYPQMYQPFEVLLVEKLRGSLGLSSPSLEHVLVSTPLGRLPGQTARYEDDIVRGAVLRAASELAV